MTVENKEKMISLLEENTKKLNEKTFNVYFYIMDTKGSPSGSLEYIYNLALGINKLGYKVSMLYSGDDFVGVRDWLGDEFADLPHFNSQKDNIELSPSDFMFIPEIFSEVMIKTKKFSCKRIVIVQNYQYLYDYLPAGVTFDNLGITDVITTTKKQSDVLTKMFPTVRVHLISPAIDEKFRGNDYPRKPIVNLVTRKVEDAARIIKPFYIKYPMYKWVTFRDLRGLPQEEFCNSLRENAFTVWVDKETKFGYSALEAMRCGTILISALPEHLSDWMVEEKDGKQDLTDCCAWFADIDEVPDMLASAMRTWTLDKIPEDIFEAQDKMSIHYTKHQQTEELKTVCVKNLFEKREKEFMEVMKQLKNNSDKN